MKKVFRNIMLQFIIVTFLLMLAGCEEKQEEKKSLFITTLGDNEVSDIVFFEGYIYAGGMEGLYRIDTNSYVYEKMESENMFMVKDLLVYDNKLYIGHDNGISVYDGESFVSILDKSYDVPDYRVNALMIDKENNLWAGTFEGALRLKEGKWESLSTDEGLAFKIVNFMMEDENGGIIFGHYSSPGEGISYVKDGKWTYINVGEGLPHNYITAGIEYNKNIYIATGFYDKSGLAILKSTDEGIELEGTIVREWGKFGSKTRSINIEDDILWIGTEYNGICLMEGDEFVRFDETDGLSNNEVKAILFTEDERVWLATRKGVSIAEKSEIYQEINLRR
jgi:ligand-binding sensor domain-containing protein